MLHLTLPVPLVNATLGWAAGLAPLLAFPDRGGTVAGSSSCWPGLRDSSLRMLDEQQQLAAPDSAFRLEEARLKARKIASRGLEGDSNGDESTADNVVGIKHDSREHYFQGMSLEEVEYICRQVHHLSDLDDPASDAALGATRHSLTGKSTQDD